MYGTGLLKGLGITLKHVTDTFKDDFKPQPSRYEGSSDLNGPFRIMTQPVTQEGLLTIQYPEEKRLLPERFRYIPMLIWDTEKEEDKCTACGICAKVCPPQCIWIVRDSDENGKPVARPAEFYIDAAVCMSCSFCVEFCPFDAIKMNHDYELAVYDRYPHLVYDKAELTVAERIKAEEKARKAEAKAKGGDAADKPKRTPEEIQAMKDQAVAKAKERAAAKKAEGGESADSGGADDEAAAKKARIEELKRKAQEKAAARKAESDES